MNRTVRTVLVFAIAGSLTTLFTGCGESDRSKITRAESQVETLAERLSQDVGADGWFNRTPVVGATDPWGRALDVKYHRGHGAETLTVWSNGPDGLPHTRDDIASHSYRCDNAVVLAEIAALKSKGRQDATENYGAALTRGLVRGSREGWQTRTPTGPTNKGK